MDVPESYLSHTWLNMSVKTRQALLSAPQHLLHNEGLAQSKVHSYAAE